MDVRAPHQSTALFRSSLTGVALVWFALLAACVEDGATASHINDYVRSIEFLPSAPPSIVEGLPVAASDDGDYRCTIRPIHETRQYDEIVAFAANSESLWPGALLQGKALYSGLFTPIVLDRAPLTASVSLESLAGSNSMTMGSPSLSSYRDALGEVLEGEITGSTPAHIYAELDEVYSEDQVALALGAGVKFSLNGIGVSIASSFNFDRKNIRSRYIVKYTQAYYTVDVDQPASPSEIFSDHVDLADVESTIGLDSPPVYVSSITYGRIVFFTLESEYSGFELGTALEAAVNAGTEVNGSISTSNKNILSRSKITAYVVGGSGAEAARALDSYESMMEFVRNGGDYSRQSPGAPIAYKLAYLADNTPVRMSFTQDYEKLECERISQRVRVTLKNLTMESKGDDRGNDAEVYGQIWAVSGDQAVLLYDRGRGEAVAIVEGTSWPTTGIISEVILDVVPEAGNVIKLGASMGERDGGLNPDEYFGRQEISLPFESGWLRDARILLTGAGKLAINLSVEPI